MHKVEKALKNGQDLVKCVTHLANMGAHHGDRGTSPPPEFGAGDTRDTNANCLPDFILFKNVNHQIVCITTQLKDYQPNNSNMVFTTFQQHLQRPLNYHFVRKIQHFSSTGTDKNTIQNSPKHANWAFWIRLCGHCQNYSQIYAIADERSRPINNHDIWLSLFVYSSVKILFSIHLIFQSNTCTPRHQQNRGYGIMLLCAQFNHELVNSAMGQIPCSTERISCF